MIRPTRVALALSVVLLPSLSHAEEPPKSSPPAAEKPTGSIDKELVKRVVQSHLGDVKRCFAHGLKERPDLKGRILVKFTIGTSGDVVDSSVEHSTMVDPMTEGCVAYVVKTWKFPKPEGGPVVVKYPFVLSASPPDGGAPPEAAKPAPGKGSPAK